MYNRYGPRRCHDSAPQLRPHSGLADKQKKKQEVNCDHGQTGPGDALVQGTVRTLMAFGTGMFDPDEAPIVNSTAQRAVGA
jgi:hypothetical protein